MRRAFLAIASVAAASLAGCGGGKVVVLPPNPAPAPTVVAAVPSPTTSPVVTSVPPTPAPPTTVAAIGPSPGPDYIRVEGYYNWLGDHYEWVSPTWVRVPRAGATYVPGHWLSTSNGYQWMPGHWQ